jgi:hypothetical protein
MSEPSPAEPKSNRILVAWAVIATIVALASISLATFAFRRAESSSSAPKANPTNQSFADLEQTIPGRYRLIEDEREIGTVTLHPDGSITNWRGETKPGYLWRLHGEGLLLIWLKDYHVFERIPKPGVYAGSRIFATAREVKSARIEKEQQ